MLAHFLRTIGASSVAGPTFINSSIATNSTGSTLSISIPTNTQSGDLLITLGIQGNATGTWSALTGWTEQLDTSGRLISSRIWDGVSSSYTYTASSSIAKTLVMLCFRNASFGVTSTVSSAVTDPVAPSITTTVNNSLIIASATLAASGNTYTVPSGFTSIRSSATNNSILVTSKNTLVSSGSQPTVTFLRASGSGTTSRALQFSVSPA